MEILPPTDARQILLSVSVTIMTALLTNGAPVAGENAISAPVIVRENERFWTLDNGIVRATIDKKNGNLPSLFYHGMNVMGPGGFWEQTPSGEVNRSLTINPEQNGGERAEVDVKGVNGHMDIELRYTLERGASGIYTYAIFSHAADYPAASEGESRFITKLNPTYFDWLSVDSDRNMLMCSPQDLRAGVVIHAKEQRILSTGVYKNSVEHKYSYCAVQYKIPAFGFSSTRKDIGVYFINPSTEYLAGGAARLDLVCHMDSTILDYWCSGHYVGGATCNVPAGENWTKVIGPIFVYCNALTNPEIASQADLATLSATAGNPTVPPAWHENGIALWQNAIAQAQKERARWPYDWVNGVDYPHREQRGSVTGRLVLDDPQAASTHLPHLTVGLAHPDFISHAGGYILRSGNGNLVTWDHDGNYYQFWNDGSEDGQFTIANVRPGTYTLHAFADGVLGEFSQTNITIEAGKNLNLGSINWKPVRYGRQLWEIGYPDRTGGKFYKGDGADYWLWGWCIRYGDVFPNDITYTIGKSDYHRDWFFEQVPHELSEAWKNPAAKDPLNQRFGWVKAGTPGENMWRVIGRGRATTWTVKFKMDQATKGQAALRLALAGADGQGGLAVAVNGRSAGTIHPVATNAIRYNSDTGIWHEYSLRFDAALLQTGDNEIQLIVPAGDVTTGVVYDYLRLELKQ
jgi:rhamnogalacturonan endolyase